MAPSLTRMRIIETSQVSPPAAAASVPADTSIPLTFFDVMWLKFAPVERLFFYPFEHSTASFMSSYLPALKSSLSLTLQSFFPLAGNIRLAPQTTHNYEIYYAHGDSVALTVAESHCYDELFGDHPREISKLKELVPCLSNTESNGSKPVLAIQVTLFPCRGLVIGISVQHSACDGSGSTSFMSTWAAICCTGTAASTPVRIDLDRSIIPDPDSEIYKTALNDLAGTSDFNMNGMQPGHEMFLASFKLKQEHIRLLKQQLQHEAEKRNMTIRCSTAVVTYAFAWVGYVKAKLSTYQNTEDVYCIFAIDHRQWFEPPIPKSYFGNCIGPGVVRAKLKDIVGPDGFFKACEAIGKTFDEVKRIGIQEARDWVKIVLETGRKSPFGTSGSLGFKVYDVDFGWGKPAKVDIVSISYSGAMSLAQSKEQGGAGAEMGFCVTQHESEIFANYFEEGLEYLSALHCIE